MVRTQIQLPEEQTAKLKKIAGECHVSMASIIRQSIDLFLKTNWVQEPRSARDRARAVAGRFHSGHTNTSQNHDEALAEAYSS
jgi:predicted transcriptional regulator